MLGAWITRASNQTDDMTRLGRERAVFEAGALVLAIAALALTIAVVAAAPKHSSTPIGSQGLVLRVSSFNGSEAMEATALLRSGEGDPRYVPGNFSARYVTARSKRRSSVPGAVSQPGKPPPAMAVITKAPGSSTYDTWARFEFEDQSRHDGFQCSLDDDARPELCDQGKITYHGLGPGWHCFQVVAVQGRLRGMPRSFCWRRRAAVAREAFRISGNAPAPLFPGTSEALDLAITNPFRFVLKMLKVSIIVEPVPTRDGAPNPGCPGNQNFLVTRQLSTTLAVPALATKSLSDLGVPKGDWPVLTMPNLPVNQDACEGVTFSLFYSGTATSVGRYYQKDGSGSVVPRDAGRALSYHGKTGGCHDECIHGLEQ